MGRIKRIVAIVTALAMLFVLDSIGVFAANGVNDQDQAVPAEETQALQEAVVSPQEEDAVEDDTTFELAAIVEPVVKPDKPKVKVLRGYKSIKLKWNKVPKADAYNVGFKKKGKWVSKGVTKGRSMVIKGLKAEKKYTFRVMAVQLHDDAKGKSKLKVSDINGTTKNGKWTGGVSTPAYVKNTQCVRRMFIKLTKKSNGKRYKSYDYGGGRYFYKGGSVSRVGASNQKAYYIHQGGWNYTRGEAEFFINEYLKKVSKKTKKKLTKKNRLIWVSTYTQHLYIFKKKGGKWKATKWNWEVSMGEAKTPSPTGNKQIVKKVGHFHTVSYWNAVSYTSSGMNALHGAESGWVSKLGNLASHGCIRNKTSNAKIIYNNCPKYTGVLIF